MSENEITQDYLKEHLEYRDGHLWWVKPTGKRLMVGQQFGTCVKGYRMGSFKNKMYYEHRLVWFYHYGKWPKGNIDHVNGDRNDNRINNLREATVQQNAFNKKSLTGSSSSHKGVTWDKNSKKWKAT